MVADAGRNVGSELLQSRQEPLEFAQLPGTAGRRQLLLLAEVRRLSARGRRRVRRHHVTSGRRQRVVDCK